MCGYLRHPSQPVMIFLNSTNSMSKQFLHKKNQLYLLEIDGNVPTTIIFHNFLVQ